jgi:hypothetical protein
MDLSTQVFVDIYHQTIRKFEEEFQNKFNSKPILGQVFRLSGYNKKRPHLGKAIEENESCQGVLYNYNLQRGEKNEFIYNPRYIYDKMKRLESFKKAGHYPDTVKINSPYDQLLFKYLDFNSLEHYDIKQNEQAINYKGFYYSFKKHRVCEYHVSVNYKKKPSFDSIPLQQFYVEQKGFHDHSDNPTYQGYGYLLEGKLQLMTWVKEGGDRLRIVLDSGNNPEKNNAMRGCIQAVSSFSGNPLNCVETVVVRHDAEHHINPDDTLRIRRYLMLHRNNFRVNAKPLNLNVMSAKGVSSDQIRGLVGLWEVFRYNSKKKATTGSILYVSEDFRIFCYNDNYEQSNLKEQVCLPNITHYLDLSNDITITMDCFPKEGAQIISTMMIKLPNEEVDVTGGVINFVGSRRSEGYPSTESTTLIRQRKLWKEYKMTDHPKRLIFDHLASMKTLEEYLREKNPDELYKIANIILKDIKEVE